MARRTRPLPARSDGELRESPDHVAARIKHEIPPIDLIVVNLYPCEETLAGGATPLEALQMATISSAEILGFEELLGSVEAGRLAHLVVLTENPLENISHVRSIRYVIHDGQLYAPSSQK